MRSILVASILLTATAAWADAPAKTPAPAPTSNPDAKQMHTDDCAKASAQNKKCVIDMKGESINGTGAGGEGVGVGFIDWGKASSLIHIRRDFIVEILKSAEDL